MGDAIFGTLIFDNQVGRAVRKMIPSFSRSENSNVYPGRYEDFVLVLVGEVLKGGT